MTKNSQVVKLIFGMCRRKKLGKVFFTLYYTSNDFSYTAVALHFPYIPALKGDSQEASSLKFYTSLITTFSSNLHHCNFT